MNIQSHAALVQLERVRFAAPILSWAALPLILALIMACSCNSAPRQNALTLIQARALWVYKIGDSNGIPAIGSGDLGVRISDDAQYADRVSFTPKFAAFLNAKVIPIGNGDVKVKIILVMINRSDHTDYSVDLPQVNFIAITPDGRQCGVVEYTDTHEQKLLIGTKSCVSKKLLLSEDQIVEQLQWSKDGRMLLCCLASFEGGDRISARSAVVVDANDMNTLHTIELPTQTRYAGWSREAGKIDYIHYEDEHIVIEELNLKDGKKSTILRHQMDEIRGGRFINVGPDGLVRFNVVTPYLPNGDRFQGFDGFRHSLVYDAIKRQLYKLDPDQGSGVFLERLENK